MRLSLRDSPARSEPPLVGSPLRAFVLTASLALVPACSCDPLGLESERFACTVDADCLEGFVCADVGAGLECVKPAQLPTDAGADGGVDAGPADAGVDAGEVDAGEDAGEADAGVDAGEEDAGFDAGFDAGEDAGVDAGEVDAGFDAGEVDAGPPATRLAITTPPQTAATGACSQVFLVETRDLTNATTPVMTATAIGLNAGPLVSFFGSSGCSGAPTTTVTVPAMQSLTTFYARGADAGAFTVTASAAGFTSASQPFTVLNPPTSLVFTTTPPATNRAGVCLATTVEARRGSVAAPVTGNTTVSLSVAPTGSVRFYSDASCLNAITSVSMATNDTTAVFFVKPLSGGAPVITAAAPFGSANQTINVTPVTRRGTCAFGTGTPLSDGGYTTALTLICPMSPAITSLSNALLFIQATALTDGGVNNGGPGSQEVRCRLLTTAAISCSRAQDTGPAEVYWQVAEIPSSLNAQRLNNAGCPTAWTVVALNTAQTFVLKASASDSYNFDDDDTLMGQVVSSTSVALSPNACSGVDVQAISWSGLNVTRGRLDGGMPDGVATVTVTGLPANSANQAVLAQPTTTLDGARQVCSSMVRASTPSSTSLSFTRGSGDAGCTLTSLENVLWERIDFGTRGVVRQYTAAFAPGQFTRSITVTPVDASRAVVFSSAQMAGGQGTGETDEGSTVTWLESAFQLVLNGSGNSVQVTRTSANAAASVTFYVAELMP